MNPTQVANLAIDIVNELWWARMEEIVAFFEAVKKQTFGKIYERIDPAFVWELWDAYCEQRTLHCEHHEGRFRQYDPRPDEGSGVGLDGIAGAIGNIKEKAKRLREIKNKEDKK